MDAFDEEVAALLGQDFGTCLSPGNSSTLISIIPSITSMETPSEPPPKLQKPNNFSNFSTIQGLPNHDRASSTPIILNFGSANSLENPRQANPRHANPEEEAYRIVSEILRSEEQTKCAQILKKPTRVRPPSQTYDHIIAERKRREQLSQRFVALSTIVPGLKKMDESSVLEDAIKYLKHHQERVRKREELAEKQSMEPVVFVRKSQIVAEDEGSSDEQSGSYDEQPLPEIEARNLRQPNPYQGTLRESEGRPCELEEEFNMTVKEVVTAIRFDLQPAARAAA
ncbi:Transcription factor [Sesamum alatum]|uniref:Transcription factor n=1 Tax=Sesamum alatum TaxID=300844 RepID=A0AAE1XRQ1_9LAMI|nr:Transcription factor [Sesamum alatum]